MRRRIIEYKTEEPLNTNFNVGTSKKPVYVKFTKGNLQASYNNGNPTWRFANNQYHQLLKVMHQRKTGDKLEEQLGLFKKFKKNKSVRITWRFFRFPILHLCEFVLLVLFLFLSLETRSLSYCP